MEVGRIELEYPEYDYGDYVLVKKLAEYFGCDKGDEFGCCSCFWEDLFLVPEDTRFVDLVVYDRPSQNRVVVGRFLLSGAEAKEVVTAEDYGYDFDGSVSGAYGACKRFFFDLFEKTGRDELYVQAEYGDEILTDPFADEEEEEEDD